MAPKSEDLEQALIDATCTVFAAEPDATSVNKVRKQVEESLGLEEGFFAGQEWKQKSKQLIKTYVVKLLDGWKPEPKQTNKRQAKDDASPEPKRRRRKSQSRSASSESDLSEPASDQNGDEKTRTEDDQPESDHDKNNKPPIDEEEEYSDVIDEPSKPKRKRKEDKDKKRKDSKPAKSKSEKSATVSKNDTAASAPDNSDEAEIKRLQSQLTKCGVRKLWHNELKPCGSDPRAKIRHLKKMLADVGMSGRFSEAKAREIKETRELLAEAEAAQEMNALWGMEGGGRASRSKARKTGKEEEGPEDDDEKEEAKGDDDGDEYKGGRREADADSEDDGDDKEEGFAARRRRARRDLAFLGDDDSDSD